jgi:NitT/TauT family transport system permease protein
LLRKWSANLGDYLIPTITLIAFLGAWEAFYHILNIPKFIVPSPSAIAAAAWEWRDRFPEHIYETLFATLLGFGVSTIVALPLAALIVYSPLLSKAIYPLLVLSQSIPKVAIAPVLMLLAGTGIESKVIMCVLIAFFPIIVDTAAGLKITPTELLDLSRSYRSGSLKTFLKIRFPMALPFIFSGLKVGITFSVTGAVVAEFMGSDRGLGYVIMSATSYWRADLAFAAMIILSIIAIILFTMVEILERVFCPWYADRPEH